MKFDVYQLKAIILIEELLCAGEIGFSIFSIRGLPTKFVPVLVSPKLVPISYDSTNVGLIDSIEWLQMRYIVMAVSTNYNDTE